MEGIKVPFGESPAEAWQSPWAEQSLGHSINSQSTPVKPL
jgi:hypothetical protein